MKIELSECMATQGGRGLLQDLANHNTVAQWIGDVVTGRAAWCPNDVRVIHNGKQYVLSEMGKVVPDAEKITKRFTKTIMNDVISIKADGFESELYINLDSEE